MIKRDIEKIFTEMNLCYNRAHDFWHFPPGVNSDFQFSIRKIPLTKKEDALQVVIRGGPVILQGWYMPDLGIKKIQFIIQEIFETYARKEIKQLFEQMGLTFYPSKNPKNERWRIPNEEITLRILVSYESHQSLFKSGPDPLETHWVIQMKGRFASSLLAPEDGIKEIQRIIHNQFERQFNKSDTDWEEMTFSGQPSWTQWSSYQPVLIPEIPKPTFYKPTQHSITKPQVHQNKPRVHRLGYSGKR